MKIALFDPSHSFRRLFKATIQETIPDVDWHEFTGLNDKNRLELQQNFDVIITSRELDNMTFTELTSEIHRSQFNKQTPIYLFSSSSSNHFLDQAFQSGITDIFAKQELSSVVEMFQKMIMFTSSVIGAHILYIEDNIAVANYHIEEFTQLGFVVSLATSCEAAYEILQKESIELVISDLNLDNGGQGQRVIREIRHNKTASYQELPIMVISSSTLPQHRICLFYLGIDEYVVKPVAPRELSLRAIHLIQKYRIEQTATQQAAHFKEIAHYDGVTESYSRGGFLDIANIYIANCKRQGYQIGILYLDLDNFKQANDSYGHAIGDQVLKLSVNILKEQLRVQDIVSRWGGDEFVILLDQCNTDYLAEITNRIHHAFSSQKEELYNVGCSIGVSHGSPKSQAELLDIIDEADQIMYSIKKRRKGNRSIKANYL